MSIFVGALGGQERAPDSLGAAIIGSYDLLHVGAWN